MIHSRNILISVISMLTLAASYSFSERPNIILILTDDLGYGDLSCYPQVEPVETPNIDALAESGVRMTHVYSEPVCAPTRAALLTGKPPQSVGVYGNYDGANPGIGPFRETFPPLLQDAGYRTAWFGKWHQGWDVSNHPQNNGFEVTYGFLGGMHDYFDPSMGDHYVGGPFAPHAFVFDGFKPVKKMKYMTTELTDRAIDVIRTSKNNPFFIFLAYGAPHTPIQAPDNAMLKYLKQGLDARAAARRGMVDVLDASVGRIMKTLKETDKERNTLVIFTSDNGGEDPKYNGGLRGTKMTVWEGGVRVPLIASYPGIIPQGTESDSICRLSDLAQTFVDLSATPAPAERLEGVNLMPFFTGENTGNAHESIVWSIHIKGGAGTLPTHENLDLCGVRKGPWKLVIDRRNGKDINALYNLDEDLSESKDLTHQFPDKKAELIAHAEEFFSKSKPSCGRIANKDTRKNGNQIMDRKLRNRAEVIIKKHGI